MSTTSPSSRDPSLPIDEWAGCAIELDERITPGDALRRFSWLQHSVLFESARKHEQRGRYSYLMADPYQWIEYDEAASESLNALRHAMPTQQDTVCGLPPFQGGLALHLSYDFGRCLESIVAPAINDFRFPFLAGGFYDTVIAWDHELDRTWIVSQGLPETEFYSRRERAAQRSAFFQKILSDQVEDPMPASIQSCSPYSPFECEDIPGVTSNLSRDAYIEMVSRAIEYIYAGDIYQVNLAQRLLAKATCSAVELYQRLARVNSAPFASWMDLGQAQIISCSPERLVQVTDGHVETRPIKGTRKRTGIPQVDLNLKAELQTSIKDRAENVMIVDLMRNDLSRICMDDSVKVRQLLEVESYASVLHLVSSIEGELDSHRDGFDVLEAVFPGGSITGAPKIRAMQIISELEPTARGAYCGSLGYIGFNGDVDFNILIRTVTAQNGWWQIPVGGGIVAQSNPQQEYLETLTKAAGMLQAVHAFQR